MIRRTLFLLCLSAIAVFASAQAELDLEAVVSTSLGTFRFEFFPDEAPNHVQQFIRLSREGYYDGSAFHRVLLNGLIHGGDPLLKDPEIPREQWGSGGLNLLPSELSDLKHDRGMVSTVRIPNQPDSDGAQFFVCIIPQPTLDGQYSVFGRVNEGMDVVEKISQQPAEDDGKLSTPVRILSVTVEPKKQEPFLNASLDELRRTVTMRTTLGSLQLQMEPDWAPENVRNFLKLVASSWLNGTEFHRLAKGFVLQGGTGYTRSSGPAHPADRWVRPVQAELQSDVKHVRGIVSMAHGDDPNSATTSFFITLGEAPALDNVYSAFARVIGGQEVLDVFEQEAVDGEKPMRRLELIEASID